MVKSHWLCEPGFHCGSSTCELGTNGNGGGVPAPATTGGVIDEKRVGKMTVLPSMPNNTDPYNTAIVGPEGINQLATAFPVLTQTNLSEPLSLTYTTKPLAADVLRRLGCDASWRLLIEDREHNPLYLGRKTKDPNVFQRMAVWSRSGGVCELPHCTRKMRHIHHVWWWSNGGPTDLDYLIGVCGADHVAIHKEKILVTALGQQRLGHDGCRACRAQHTASGGDRLPRRVRTDLVGAGLPERVVVVVTRQQGRVVVEQDQPRGARQLT